MKDRMFFFRNSPAIAGLFVVALAQAEVPIVESSPVNSNGQVQSGNPAVTSSRVSSRPSVNAPGVAQDSLYYQLDLLQQEVQALRGLVEEQAHAMRMMKQEQRDRYIDLDRRITKSSGGAGLPAGDPGSTNATKSPAIAPAVGGSETGSLEKQAYADAFELIKSRKFEQAVASLNAFLTQYPSGAYAANARYWLGEVYLAVNNPEQAKEAFKQVLTDFPEHRKAPDAGYKLGRVYVTLGDKAKAREYFEMTVSTYPGTPSARLSREFLKEL